jgi:hypothetical protein
MELTIDGFDILLDKTKEDIASKLQDKVDEIFVLAKLLGYEISFGNNIYSRQMHCYFKTSDYSINQTLSFHYDEDNQFTQYSIYIWNNDTVKNYRKRGSATFYSVLDDFKMRL